MRIKFNATAVEIEVLDIKGERVFYAKTDGYQLDADVEAILAEVKSTIESVNDIG